LQGQEGVELNIEDEDKPSKKAVKVEEVEVAKAVEHVLEPTSAEKKKKEKAKKTKKSEEEPTGAEKKKATRKKKVLIGDINEV
jgi:hypothetical protein